MTQISVYGNYHVRKKSDRTYAPSNQLFYGPYVAETDLAGIDLAWAEMSEVFTGATAATTPPIGWTFGVQNSTTGVITEYWLSGGHTKDCIVKKGSTYTAGKGISSDQMNEGVIAVDFADEDVISSMIPDTTSSEESGETTTPDTIITVKIFSTSTNFPIVVIVTDSDGNGKVLSSTEDLAIMQVITHTGVSQDVAMPKGAYNTSGQFLTYSGDMPIPLTVVKKYTGDNIKWVLELQDGITGSFPN